MLTSAQVVFEPREKAELKIAAHVTKPVRRKELRRVLLHAVRGQLDHTQCPPTTASVAEVMLHKTSEYEPKVLLVEDNRINQEVATSMLEGLGCRLTIVENGRLAVQAVEQEDFDIVLMDCQMPEMDGFDSTRRIRALEDERQSQSAPGSDRPARLPIVAVTAHALPEDRERSLSAGMDDHLTKPFSQAGLVGVIERWLPALFEGKPRLPTGESASVDDGDTRSPGATESCEVLNDAALDQLAALPGAEASGLVARVVDMYLETCLSLGSVIRQASDGGDAVELSRAAHRLKSNSFEIGAERAGKLCEELEQMARAGILDGTATLAVRLEGELDRVCEELESRSKRPSGQGKDRASL